MEVKPFKAFRFNETMVGDVGDCISPPYDVISPALQQRLYEKNKYNIVRIIKGKTDACDNTTNNQYTKSANYLNSWIQKGILKQDQIETIYAYVQDFELGGTEYRRLSFIALGRLEEFGKGVRPHEQTLDAPVIDRLSLRRAAAAEFGLVFMLYKDEKKIVDSIIEETARQSGLIDFIDEQNVRHRLFAITAADDIDAITKMMADKSCIIADGHHRYIAGLSYSKENSSPSAKYQMIAFVNIRHEGWIVLATHRLVGNLENFDSEKLFAGLRENFEITEYTFNRPQAKTEAKQKMLAQMKAEVNRDKNAFGIYCGRSAFSVAVLKDKRAMDTAAPNKSGAWRLLDVSVLHKLILEAVLGIGEKKLAKGGNIEYIKDTSNAVDELIAKVDSGQKQAAFFMNGPRMEQIIMVAENGERMPQKSTYFYPKIYTGLTINKL